VAGEDHRRWTLVNGMNDLGVVNPAQVHRGDREVGVAQLALDHEQRDPLARHLHRVSMAQLVLVPTSAQASICRPLGYADQDAEMPQIAGVFVGKIGIATAIAGLA
jgi:hypothetical protein